jgi:hypothetical protein
MNDRHHPAPGLAVVGRLIPGKPARNFAGTDRGAPGSILKQGEDHRAGFLDCHRRFRPREVRMDVMRSGFGGGGPFRRRDGALPARSQSHRAGFLARQAGCVRPFRIRRGGAPAHQVDTIAKPPSLLEIEGTCRSIHLPLKIFDRIAHTVSNARSRVREASAYPDQISRSESSIRMSCAQLADAMAFGDLAIGLAHDAHQRDARIDRPVPYQRMTTIAMTASDITPVAAQPMR